MLKSLPSQLFILLLFLLPQSFLLAQKQEVKQNYQTILFNAGKMIEMFHYEPKPFNDSFSSRLYHEYFRTLDPSSMIFLQSDLDQLRHFEFQLDDEIKGKGAQFFLSVNSIYLQRIHEAKEFCDDLLKMPINTSSQKVYDGNRRNKPFPKNADEKKELWELLIRYRLLNQLEDLIEANNKDSVKVSEDSLEKRARALVTTIQERYFNGLIKKTTEEEAFSSYVNTLTNLFDPHSSYFLPVDRRGFQEGMSGVYYGIGAVLQSRDGQVVISELVVGGPAWRSQQVEKGDVIVKVGQDDGELVNVEGMPMEDLIKLTRGAKGSSVTIAFRKADGSIQNVRMVRTALQLDDTFVKSAIIEDDGKKFGFIHLPKFYTNFGDENGRSCADDIEKELKKLMREKVDGIILDIRSNGGGSLGEVINMVGLFVDRGPVVQVKGRGNDKQVGQVTKRKVYDGPLAILVNELSASASEIFAGAMQDYKRGIIIGSPSTYGKGTVQRTFPMPGRNWAEQESDLGTIHITVQKYYRITGNSTQLKGVEPDIKLPGFYEHMEVREKHLETAMPWDEISSAGFSVSKVNAERIKLAVQKSLERQEKDTILQRLKYHLNWISGRNNLYSLDRNKFRDERNLLKEHTQKSREYSVLNYKLNIRNTQEDEIRISAAEEFRQENNKSWLRNLEKDRYLGEALHVVKDMAELREIEIPESRPFQPAGRQGEKKVVMKQREAA